MKNWITLIVLISFFSSTFGQDIYMRTFGDSSNNALIYLHGGPGYNSASFEATAAEALANEGFYVIVYDRRGEGRSSAILTEYTFKESIDELNFIYDSLNLSKAALIGHSFGGVIGTKFATTAPEKVDALIMLGAPVNLQVTFKTILRACTIMYSQNNNPQGWAYVNALAKADTTTIAYSSECFNLAMHNGFYSPSRPTGAARKILKQFEDNTALYKIASKMQPKGPVGFMQNEKYTSVDLTAELKALKANGQVQIYGLYGKEDGLYSPEQIENLRALIGADNVLYLSRCSHNSFIDQQAQFLKAMLLWCS